MARIRTIKPEFWTSEQVMNCSRDARLLFIGLWNFCDDYGRHPANSKQLKALIFPDDNLSEKIAGTARDAARGDDDLSAAAGVRPCRLRVGRVGLRRFVSESEAP